MFIYNLFLENESIIIQYLTKDKALNDVLEYKFKAKKKKKKTILK